MWLDSVIQTLGPGGLGALVGGLTGAGGAVLAGSITAVSATRRERRSRLFSEQKAVYAAYSKVVRNLQEELLHPGDQRDILDEENKLVGELEILASKRVQKMHKKVLSALHDLLDEKVRWIDTLDEEARQAGEAGERITPDAQLLAAHKRLEKACADLEAAMRRDLGVK
jgi:hypothetical protein